MIQISSADKCILTLLFSVNKPIDIYQIHEMYGFSPAHISSLIHKISDDTIIQCVNEQILLTEYGRKWVINNRKEIFMKDRSSYWKSIPLEWRLSR